MKTQTKKGISTKVIALTAILTALVVILQFLGQFVRFGPFAISLVLIPIVIGAATCGPKASAWLGLVFGAVVLISDAQVFIAINLVGTIVTVFLKGFLAGLLSGIAYKLIAKKNVYLAVFVSAIVCPIVNTGVFLMGCVVFFMDAIVEWSASLGFASAFEYMILGMVGVNFLIEIATNVILSPVVVRLLNIRERAK